VRSARPRHRPTTPPSILAKRRRCARRRAALPLPGVKGVATSTDAAGYSFRAHCDNGSAASARCSFGRNAAAGRALARVAALREEHGSNRCEEESSPLTAGHVPEAGRLQAKLVPSRGRACCKAESGPSGRFGLALPISGEPFIHTGLRALWAVGPGNGLKGVCDHFLSRTLAARAAGAVPGDQPAAWEGVRPKRTSSPAQGTMSAGRSLPR
jgi:hypothetical protein